MIPKAASRQVPARYVLLLDDYFRSSGSSLAAVLRSAEVDPDRIRETDFSLSEEQIDTFIEEGMRLAKRSDIGFEWGRRLKLNSHDILGYAMLSAPNLDRVLRLCSRYYRLLTPMFRMLYHRTGDRAELIFRPAHPMRTRTLNVLQEAIAVSVHFQCTPLLQTASSVYDMYMPFEEPPHVARYRELAPARVHFGPSALPEIRIVADTWSLDAPLPMADEHAVRRAEDRCKLLLKTFSANGNFRDWVVMMLNEADSVQPTIEELAQMLGISARTLDRHLQNENCGFRVLSTQVRDARARTLLVEGELSVSQIAYKLGFTDVANFSRAFRRANGVSPSDFRAGERGAR
ncbi:AraC family transcriptional regulator ligand-binding domain-containing protein [Paraburkholderia sp. EG287A]|uniref:AraC family transcriptional regulator n=1 Tax=unclassified Paraburkholderia TaxID=2615204 RepID=UPI0034D22B07